MFTTKRILMKEKKYLRVYKYLFRYKSWILLAMFFTFLNTLLQIPFPIITRIIIDDVIVKGKTHLITPAVVGIISVIPFLILVPFLYRLYAFKLTHKTGIMLRKALCEHFLHLHLSIFQEKGPGYFSARIYNDVDRLVGSVYQVLFPILQNLLLFLVGLTMILWINWKLAMIPVCSFPIYGYLTLYFSRRLKKENAVLAEKKALSYEFFTDMVQRVKNIRCHVLEKSQQRSFFKKDSDVLRQNSKAFVIKIAMEGLNNFMMILTPALVLILGINMILDKSMTLGEYVAFNSFMTYMMGPIKFFFASNMTFQDFKVALDRVADAFEWETSFEYLQSPGSSAPLPAGVFKNGTIRLENVSFSYDNRSDVLKNISLTIEPGERVALMGKSGSGKTTILNLIMGLYPPGKGKINFGDRSYDQIDVAALRRRIAFVEQEPILFDGSVEENIMLSAGKTRRFPGDLREAAQFAGAHEFISKMEGGYKTDLKRFGSDLSVGQKQRIALSRSFFKDVRLIVLDEPTSAVDNQSALLIREALANVPPDRTIIIVTHNPLIADFADRLIIVDNGEIVHDGHPEPVPDPEGAYKENTVKEKVR